MSHVLVMMIFLSVCPLPAYCRREKAYSHSVVHRKRNRDRCLSRSRRKRPASASTCWGRRNGRFPIPKRDNRGMPKIRLHKGLSHKQVSAIAKQTLASRGVKVGRPRIGDKMPDGSIYAGVSPETGTPLSTGFSSFAPSPGSGLRPFGFCAALPPRIQPIARALQEKNEFNFYERPRYRGRQDRTPMSHSSRDSIQSAL
jgi:hypothetical protein